jgi:hypothetical protein
MPLPFTRDQFFDVFAAYNESFWPVAFLLWLASLAAAILLVRGRSSAQHFINLLLIVNWTWAALAYHAAFFSRINPAAWLFSGLFLVQAGLLARQGLASGRLRFSWERSLRYCLSWVLLGYALVYPALAFAEGNDFPRLPTFGIPCPTAILTIGFLLAADRPPMILTFIPILWAFIGGSAAFLLGVRTDLMLLAAGVSLLVYMIVTRTTRSDPSRSVPS